MKILVTVNTYYPKLDGVQAVTDYLTTGLVQKGHEITVVTTMSPGLPAEEIYKGIRIIRVNIYTRYACYYGDKNAYRKLILELTKQNDVMINVCTQQALTDLLFPILDEIPCKKVLHIHGINDFKWRKSDFVDLKHFVYKIWKNFRWWKLYQFNADAIKKYDAVLQLHRFDPGYIFFKKKYGIKSYILENACDEQFGDLSKINKEKYCICIANYTIRKNQAFLLKAFYQAKIPKDWKLILVGSEKNAYYDSLVELTHKLERLYGYHNIEIKTSVSRKETIELVKNASIYLLGSTWEAFSISIIESMASAVPFISTNTGVTRFMPGGVIVDSVESMSYWIELFVEHEELCQYYGNAGHEYYHYHLTTKSKINTLNNILNNI